LKENEKERLANARLEKVRTERERKKRESAIEEEKELQIHLKKRITHERFALEQLNEEHERQTRNADVWEKRREVVNAFEHRAEERDHFMEKQERDTKSVSESCRRSYEWQWRTLKARTWND